MQPGELFERRYRIEREVGRGSFGIVYAATDMKEGRRVAIKVLLPWTRAVESLRHRLKREAKLTRLLDSPHAVKILDLDESATGDLYIVMELLEGEELSQLLRREKQISPERATEIGCQVLDALAKSHRLGVIHRDLKPPNIYLCRTDGGDDNVKVLDFGIAKVAGREDGSGLMETTRLTTPGGVLGTPAYMSPEQCRGDTVGPASDFYSLGVVLYELISGRVPFDDPNPVQILVLHNSLTPPSLPAPVAGTRIASAVQRALEKDPQARFRDADEFLFALGAQSAAQAAGQPTFTGHAQRTPAPNLDEALSGSIAPKTAPAKGSARALPWRNYLIALAIAALVGTLAFCLFYLGQ
jgi:serine/threonine-protein kinase